MARILMIAIAGLILGAEPPTPPPPAPAPVPSPARPISEFKPSIHGFHFANSFTGSPLPIKLGGIEHALGVPSQYGLCGGMSFAAADFFLARRTVPNAGKPPAEGTLLYTYINQRQTDSLGDRMKVAVRFSQWMSRPDDGWASTHELTLGELPGIEDAVERDEPALLGLVFSKRGPSALAGKSGGGALWENHQVLAYGIVHHAAGTTDLSIYDPNYPGADGAMIRCQVVIVGDDLAAPLGGWRVPVFGVRCDRIVPGKRTMPVRGVFRMPYAPASPPAKLD